MLTWCESRRFAPWFARAERTASGSGRGRGSVKDGVAHPLSVGVAEAPELEARLRRRTVTGHHPAELVPVRLGVVPAAFGLVVGQVRVRDAQAELADARDVDAQELLAQLLVVLALDAPVQVLVLGRVGGRAVHLHERPPPSV